MEKYGRSGCRERSLHTATPIPHTGAGRWGRAGGDQDKADLQRVGPFWALSPCPWQGGSWLLLGYAFSYSIRKGNYECPNPHISGSSCQAASFPVPPCHPALLSHLFFLTAQGPISSYALKTSSRSNTLLALPHKGQILTVLAISAPSPLHMLHMLQLPPSTLPLEWGKQPLPTPSDLKLISGLWG